MSNGSGSTPLCDGCGLPSDDLRDDGQSIGFLVCGKCERVCDAMAQMPVGAWPSIRPGESSQEWTRRAHVEVLGE